MLALGVKRYWELAFHLQLATQCTVSEKSELMKAVGAREKRSEQSVYGLLGFGQTASLPDFEPKMLA